jgi:hypothetical protein
MAGNRDDFPAMTISVLARRVGTKCSNPDCRIQTTAPVTNDPGKVATIGVAAHIEAAAPGGPRYNAAMTPTQRKDITNGIWLCNNCSTKIDRDAAEYPVELLRAWKDAAEKAARDELGSYQRLSVPKNQVAEAARALLENAKRDARFPVLRVPIRMSFVESPTKVDRSKAETTTTELASIAQSSHLLVYGEAGIGKTTVLIEIGEILLSVLNAPIPIYVNAAMWAASGYSLMEYTAKLPIVSGRGIELKHLAALNEAGALLYLVNGWNEIEERHHSDAETRLADFVSGSGFSQIVVSTRKGVSGLQAYEPRMVEVKGLDVPRRIALIDQHLAPDAAALLKDRLQGDRYLLSITRNPFFLAAILELCKAGLPVPANRYELLLRLVQSYEKDAGHQQALSRPPLRGHHWLYLESLARAMNENATAALAVEDARRAVNAQAAAIAADGQISQTPEPDDILATLSDHHLLQWALPRAQMRFSHQRIQEFFGAHHLVSLLTAQPAPADFQAKLIHYLNKPFWEDSAFLLAEGLMSDKALEPARELLLKSARTVDLALACGLASAMSLNSAGDAGWDEIKQAIDVLYADDNEHIKAYAVELMVISESIDFGELLWSLLESDDQNTRLDVYHSGPRLRIAQLGTDFERRFSAWTPARRAELLWQLHGVPENNDVIDRLAKQDESPEVRDLDLFSWQTSAIAEKEITAEWIAQPDDYKLTPRQLRRALDLWRPENKELTGELLRLARQTPELGVANQIGLQLLQHAEEVGVSAAKEILAKKEDYFHAADCVQLLRAADPSFLADLAAQRATSYFRNEPWVKETILGLPALQRQNLVERALSEFAEREHPVMNLDLLAGGASESQVAALISEALSLCTNWRAGIRLDPDRYKRLEALERVIQHVPGPLLLDEALKQLPAAPYFKATWLLERIYSRARSDKHEGDSEFRYIPSVAEMDQLSAVMRDKQEPLPGASCMAEAVMADLLSMADPVRYLPEMLRLVEIERLAWEAWETTPARRTSGARVSNPSGGRSFVDAFRRCGFAAAEGLLVLLRKGYADHTILECLFSIVSTPWQARVISDRIFGMTYLDLREIHLAAGLRSVQPDASMQPLTDVFAAHLADRLTAFSTIPDSGPTEVWGDIKAPHKPWSSAVGLSKIPSPIGDTALPTLLLRADAPGSSFVEMCQNLISRGSSLASEGLLRALANQIENLLQRHWLDDSARHVLADLIGLLPFVLPQAPAQALYLALLPRTTNKISIYSLTEKVSRIKSDEAIPYLRMLIDHFSNDFQAAEPLILDLIGRRTAQSFEALLDLVETKQLVSRAYGSVRHSLSRSVGSSLGVSIDKAQAASLVARVTAWEDPANEIIACSLLATIGKNDALVAICKYLDESRYPQAGGHAQDTLVDLFQQEVSEEGQSWYEIQPKSRNFLRSHLFDLARASGTSSSRAKRILIRVERQRLSQGRTPEEPRHPRLDSGLDWPRGMWSADFQ